MNTASITRRWAALWLDYFFIGIVAALANIAKPALGFLTWIALAGAYFPCFELLAGATPGKRILSLLVVSKDDGSITPRTILLRSLPNVIEINPLLLGGAPAGLVALFTSQRTRLGDILAKTRVVHAPAGSPRFIPLAESRRTVLLALPLYLVALVAVYALGVTLPSLLLRWADASRGIPIGLRLLLTVLNFFSSYGLFLAPLLFSPFLAFGTLVSTHKRAEPDAANRRTRNADR
jgi:uncharacterized RDD family membrane protein YckC